MIRFASELPGRIYIVKGLPFIFLTLLWAMPCHAQWNYPPTKTVGVSDTYFWKTYYDSYRWFGRPEGYQCHHLVQGTGPVLAG
jgi:hypothetical protein